MKPEQPTPESPKRPSNERFVRGLTLGALIGAAIAGSTLWDRFRLRRAPEGRADGTADRT